MRHWKIEDYQIDIVVEGYPGKSVCHGALGWSSIVLLRGHGHIALVDVGTFGIRKTLIDGWLITVFAPRMSPMCF